MTNLVIIPLEGVSQTLFWQYREAMPTLWNLSNKSAMFRRFYTASTSAFQSFCDFMHGDSSELDHNTAYPAGPGCLLQRNDNLFGLLENRGYETLGLQRASSRTDYAADNFWGAWPKSCGDFLCHEEYDSFHAAADSFLDQAALSGKPFALYYSDRASTVQDEATEKSGAVLFHQRFEKGFSLLDRSVARLLAKLENLGLLSNTIVVAFGPYGMDPWKHAVNGGRVHAIDPYADMCWTPLMIYFNDNDICIADQLVSVIDLKHTIMHMLFPNEPPAQPATPLTGVDILSFRRQAAFTQNMFALEREGTESTRGLVKSYGVTDGDQRLIVSSGGGVGGLELFYDPRDPGNTRNFLDFFNLDANGVMTAFGCSDVFHVHFTQSFKPNLVMSVAQSYNTMREQLFGFIKFKEQEALKHAGAEGAGNIFPEDAFTRKRRRR